MSGFDVEQFLKSRGEQTMASMDHARQRSMAKAAHRAGLLRGAEIAREEADNCIDTDGPVACNKIATAIEAEANKEVPRG